MLHAPVHLYRWGFGGLLGKRFLLLTHIGRRTGLRHQTVLEVMEYRDLGPQNDVREFVVMSGFGRKANWLQNIEAARDAEIIVGSKPYRASFRFLGEEEAMKVVAAYERRKWFMVSIVRWVLSRLLGWQYHGSEADRRRLVSQLPLVAFRPR